MVYRKVVIEMAKKSAYGRNTLIEIKFFKENTEVERTSLDTTITLAVMSDRKILEKMQATFKDDYSPNGIRKHSYGWKTTGRKIKETDTTTLTLWAESKTRQYEAMGYTKLG